MFKLSSNLVVDNNGEGVKSIIIEFKKYVFLISKAKTNWKDKKGGSHFIWFRKRSVFVGKMAFRFFNKKKHE